MIMFVSVRVCGQVYFLCLFLCFALTVLKCVSVCDCLVLIVPAGWMLTHLTPAVHDCSPLPDQLCKTVCGNSTPTAGNISCICSCFIQWLEPFTNNEEMFVLHECKAGFQFSSKLIVTYVFTTCRLII